MQDPNCIVVTGMGLTTPLGNTINEFWDGLIKGQSAIKQWEDLKALDFKYTHACRISDLDCDPLRRGFHLAKQAIAYALNQSKISQSQRIGLYLGTTMGESAAYEAFAEGSIKDYPANFSGDSICKLLSHEFKQIKESQCFATACAAGNYAIRGAMLALQAGKVDVALAGGVDPFSKIAYTGFSRSRAMSPSGMCKPFSAERDGMILGEGAGFLVLQRVKDAKFQKQNILAVVDGCALSCDAYHPTAPKPDSSGIVHCFESLLKMTNTKKNNIDWICSHGTGTKLSDSSEAQAINNFFEYKSPFVSSLKAHIGHTLGAATALEAIASILAIQHQTIPPTANSKKTDMNIKLVIKPIKTSINHVLNCGYAFGGLNSITQFSKWN